MSCGRPSVTGDRSLLIAHCSLLDAHYSLLVARCSLLAVTCEMLLGQAGIAAFLDKRKPVFTGR